MERYVLVTGACGGLGRATVSALSEAGFHVFACDLILTEPSARVIPIRMDVSDLQSVRSALEFVRQRTERLYAIVNLAGIFRMDTVSDGDTKLFRDCMDINFWGTYYVNHEFLCMLERGARIINMSSELGGYSPQPFNGYYCVTKHTVDAYTDSLARELAYVGIHVAKIRAGSFRTGMLNSASENFARVAQQNALLGPSVLVFSRLVDGELQKGNSPKLFAELVRNILNVRRPRRRYRIRNSFKLRALDAMPLWLQDRIYLLVVRLGERKTERRGTD